MTHSRSQPMTATPTPWAADPDWREGYSWNIHIVDAANPDMRICFMTSDGPAQANADLIVEAVNNYDRLRAELASARKALEASKAAMLRTRTASIAGCEEGYGKPEQWADELFRSHGDLTNAIKLCDAALGQSK